MVWKSIKLMLVLLCMITIFMFSNDSGYESDEKSNTIIVRVAEVLAGHSLDKEEREAKIEQYVTIVRKSAHFIIYLVLGLLLISYIKEYKIVNWKSMFFAFVIAFLYACSDEVHQLFVPGRSGNIIDVGIDSLGAYLGITIYYLYYKWRKYE